MITELGNYKITLDNSFLANYLVNHTVDEAILDIFAIYKNTIAYVIIVADTKKVI
ncbi:hypothetical protein IFN73_10560 [Francisella tularensis subsp. holarctica]|nr:hypothetical protein [Francisella tularensis subsp. holarctica]